MINLTSLFLFISISAPLAALSLIAMTIIVFSMMGIVVLFKALTTLLKSFVNIKTILTLIIFSMIVGILTFILVLIAKAAAIVVENAGNIFRPFNRGYFCNRNYWCIISYCFITIFNISNCGNRDHVGYDRHDILNGSYVAKNRGI